MKKPLIGIVSKFYTIDMTQDGDENPCIFNFYRIMSEVNDALIKNGALTFSILPQESFTSFDNEDEHKANISLTNKYESLNDIINLCDGIVLPGDISSNPYEEYVAKYCYDNDIPTLGICAGFNNMIRAMNGTTKKIDNLDVHDRPDLKYAHVVNILSKDSIIYKCSEKDSFMANSIHTYVADNVPKIFDITAIDCNGYAEVIEAKNKIFYMGVKFHPELLQDNEIFRNIFLKFLEKTSINKK